MLISYNMETTKDKIAFPQGELLGSFKETHGLSGLLRQLVASVQDFDGQCHRVVFVAWYMSRSGFCP